MGVFLLGGVLFVLNNVYICFVFLHFRLMVSVGIFTLGGDF